MDKSREQLPGKARQTLGLITRGIPRFGTISRTKAAVWCLVGLGLLAIAPGGAVAEIIVHVPDVTVEEGVESFFDVFFEVTPDTPETPMLAGYQLKLDLTDESGNEPSGVRFVDFDLAEEAVFPGKVPLLTNPGRWGLPGPTLAVNDFLMAGEAPVNDGAGLIRVMFTTDPGSAGVYQASIDAGPLGTMLTNGQGMPLAIDLTSSGAGTITVIPEPSALVGLLAMAAAGLAAFAWRRRRTVEAA